MPQDIETAARFAKLVQAVGFAVWQFQELENTAITYVVVRLRSTRGVGLEKGAAMSQEVAGLTFGRLLAELKQSGVLEPAVVSRLEALNKERVWVVHYARRESRGILASPPLLANVHLRLDAMAEQSLALTKQLGRQVEEYVVSSGVSQEFIDSEADRLARAWGITE